ncbi:MAG: hypothetical protein CMC19_04365 [Flavobacteriaceae bacterium]|nr:hypothetical protein [Flavobacteriaceae bacterium]
MKKTTILFSIILCLSSCNFQVNNDKSSEVPEKVSMSVVLDIHDEVMPKMSTIAKLSSELKPLIKEDSLAKEKFDNLVHAHEEMMNWMQAFGTKFNSDEIMNGAELSEEKREILAQEKIAITEVKEAMLYAISDAENYLK